MDTKPNQPARPATLDQITARLKDRVSELIENDKNAVRIAMVMGDDLAEAKPLVGHGNWAKWLAECGIVHRKARKYMLLARHRGLIEANWPRAANLEFSIRDALKLISPPKERASSGPKLLAEIETPELLGKFLEEHPSLFFDALQHAPTLKAEVFKRAPMPLTRKEAKRRRREANRQIAPLVGPDNRSISIH
jgi:hypothetical protein